MCIKNTIKYKRLGINDLDRLVEMRMLYVREESRDASDDVFLSIENNLPGYFERHIDNELFAFAATDGDTVISIALLLVIEKPPNTRFVTGKIGNVLNVYTRPEYRRKGIAFNVMESLIEYARTAGLDFLELQATQDGHPLYEKLGFVRKNNHYTPMKLNISEI